MNKLFKLGFFLAFVLLIEAGAFAQGFAKKNKYWAFGGALNAMNYVGELDPGPSFISPGIKFTKYNFGVDAQYRFHPRMFARATFSYGRIKGADAENSKFSTAGGDVFRKLRNLSFRSQIYEFKADVVFDFFEHRGKYQKRPDFVPYGFVGLAYFHHSPQAELGGKWLNLREYSTEGQGVIDGAPKKYSLHQIALPIGLGIRYKISKQLDISFEMGWRFTTTDYLDDVGGKYVDKVELYDAMGGKGATSVQLSDRTPEIYDEEAYQDWMPGPVEAYSGAPTDAGDDVYFTYTGEYGAKDGQRGDKKGRRDAYIITGFHLTYIIPQKVICPKFR